MGRHTRIFLACICLLALGIQPRALASPASGSSGAAEPAAAPAASKRKPLTVPARFDPMDYAADAEACAHGASACSGKLVVKRPEGDVVLTLVPHVQHHLEDTLAEYDVPAAAVVVMEVRTGKLIAYVNHALDEEDDAAAIDRVRDAAPPAASVFKIVTAAALLDKGVQPDTKVCYSGGFSRLEPADLRDDPGRDRQCATLADAMGQSINTVFAKLALRHLTPSDLQQYAQAFGFGETLPFDLPMQASKLEVPEDELEFARTAAGFWHMHLSPLHGALLAAAVANDGQMPRPHIIERMRYPCGEQTISRSHEPLRRVIAAETAAALARMMERTVTNGTAYRGFHDLQGNPFLPGVTVAGKTGSLSDSNPYRAYSWWVGFAPADEPRYAVSALVINGLKWRIKASFVAREALRKAMQKADPSRLADPSELAAGTAEAPTSSKDAASGRDAVAAEQSSQRVDL